MNLIKLKMATTVAAVLTIVATIAPQAAYAQRIGGIFAAPSNVRNDSQNDVSFALDTSVLDSNPDPNVGNYVGAIQNFVDTDISGPLAPLSFSSGNLTSSIIEAPSNLDAPVPGPGRDFGFTFNDLINAPNIPGAINFKNGGLRYEVTFNDNPDVRLTLLIPSTDPGLINSLSGVSQFTSIPGVVSRSSNVNDDELFGNFGNRSPRSAPFTFQDSTPVPEPDATAGMLALGGLGAISLHRRNRRYSKHLSNRNPTLYSKAERHPL